MRLVRTSKDIAIRRKTIFDLQDFLIDNIPDQDKLEAPVNHHFAPGVYAREMIMPKGYLVVGRIHKYAHLTIISYGKCVVATEDGVEYIEGPHTFTSKVGAKRVVYALEETMWTTIHPTDETDPEKIVKEVTVESYEELDK